MIFEYVRKVFINLLLLKNLINLFLTKLFTIGLHIFNLIKLMKLINDNFCSWINDLNLRENIKSLEKDLSVNWLIVGAGFTGLSAARKLGEIFPKEKIIIVGQQYVSNGEKVNFE